MKVSYLLLTTALATGALGPGASYAAGCDPAQFLKYEEIKYSKDIALQVIYFDSLSQSARDNIDTGGGFVFDGVPINGKAARDTSNALSKQLRIDFKGEQRTWYTISRLSPGGKEAYLACLKDTRDNFQLELVGDPIESENFVVLVKSTPRENLSNKLRVSGIVTSGRIVSSDKTILSTKTAQIVVQRDPSKETIITVRVGDDIKTITLPPRPNSIALQVRESKREYGDVYGGQSDIVKDLCVTIPNDEQDAAILPQTMALHMELLENTHGGVYLRNPMVTTRSACGKGEWHLSVDPGRVRGTAWVTALVAKVIPTSPAPIATPPTAKRRTAAQRP